MNVVWLWKSDLYKSSIVPNHYVGRKMAGAELQDARPAPAPWRACG